MTSHNIMLIAAAIFAHTMLVLFTVRLAHRLRRPVVFWGYAALFIPVLPPVLLALMGRSRWRDCPYCSSRIWKSLMVCCRCGTPVWPET